MPAKIERKIFTHDEIYPILARALTEKQPSPPAGWCASKLDDEILRATKVYEPDAFLRQQNALGDCLAYLVDFARRMPEWIDVTEKNERVREMCGELASEVEKIAFAPEEIINERGKLKSWLKAILAVQTCLIYREELAKKIAENDAAKRAARLAPVKTNSPAASLPSSDRPMSNLAINILQKVIGKSPEKSAENSSEQPSLF